MHVGSSGGQPLGDQLLLGHLSVSLHLPGMVMRAELLTLISLVIIF